MLSSVRGLAAHLAENARARVSQRKPPDRFGGSWPSYACFLYGPFVLTRALPNVTDCRQASRQPALETSLKPP
jgi:hypothetical protein